MIMTASTLHCRLLNLKWILSVVYNKRNKALLCIHLIAAASNYATFFVGVWQRREGRGVKGKLMPKGRAKTEGPCGKMNKQTPLQGENYAVSQWHFPSSCAKFKSYGTTSSAEFGEITVKAWKVRWNLHLYKWQGFEKSFVCFVCPYSFVMWHSLTIIISYHSGKESFVVGTEKCTLEKWTCKQVTLCN